MADDEKKKKEDPVATCCAGGARKAPACACAPPSDGSDPSFDRLAEMIQAKVDKSEEEYFPPAIIRECKYPKNVGRMDDADGSAKAGTVGESMEFFLKFGPEGKVTAATFTTDGCGSTVASGSMLTQLVEGKTGQMLERLTARDLSAALGGLPPAQMHCGELAIEAMRAALKASKK